MLEIQLKQWHSTIPGRLVGEQEAAVLRAWLDGIFGYRLVQLGGVSWPGEDPLVVSPIGHKIRFHRAVGGFQASGVADPGRLPLASDSIDLALLPHTLDFCTDPRRVLREVERVLIADGRLITMNFNPWSLWGLRRAGARLFGNTAPPWDANFTGYLRLSDWLSLLGLEIEKTEVMMFRPPLKSEGMMRRARFLERTGRRLWPFLAGVYMVQAIKRVQTLTPVRPNWHRLRQLKGGALEPTVRGT
jgi:SAM-dependent methyltransferase